MYYFTLFLTPMVLLSGVFFPAAQLPAAVQTVAAWLPLTHAVALIRPLIFGELPQHIAWHVGMLLAIAGAAFAIALHLTRRRLLK
jgi:lipooligosaccharide transport system permease protein